MSPFEQTILPIELGGLAFVVMIWRCYCAYARTQMLAFWLVARGIILLSLCTVGGAWGTLFFQGAFESVSPSQSTTLFGVFYSLVLVPCSVGVVLVVVGCLRIVSQGSWTASLSFKYCPFRGCKTRLSLNDDRCVRCGRSFCTQSLYLAFVDPRRVRFANNPEGLAQ